MKVLIEDVCNGFVVSTETGAGKEEVWAFSEGYDEFGEIEALASALRQVVDSFGLRGSKHDKKRIYITVEEKKDL
jgi:hypothetical protein